MNKYILKFLKSKSASQLPAYLDALERKKEDTLFLMSRSVLHFYVLLASELGKDRFLNRCYCLEEYVAAPQELDQYQTIYLAGDAMSSGYQLFRNYCILKKMAQKHRVVSIVYALSTEFMRDSLFERMYGIYYEVYNVALADQAGAHREAAVNMWKDFVGHLYCHRYLHQENMSLFSLAKTCLLQENTRTVMSTFTTAKYKRPATPVRMWLESLCQNTTDWRYVPLNFADVTCGTFPDGLQMGYFECRQHTADLNSILVNSVILCKYWEDSTSDVIFAPVSIGRSCKKDQLWEVFHKMVGDTLPTKIVERPAENDLHSIYRRLLNISSSRIGDQFQKLLHSKGFPPVNFENGLFDLPLDNAAQAVEVTPQSREFIFLQETPGLSYAFHLVKNDILRRESSGYVPISAEDIEEFLVDHTQNPHGAKSLLTGVLLLLIETAVCSNAVFIVDGMIKNAFIPEENSNCLLSAGEQVCHICADVLYISQGADEYETQKSTFLAQMGQELKSMDVFADEFSEKLFCDYSAMLERASREDNPYKILGKRFLVRNLCGLLKNVQAQAIRKLEER